MMSGLPLEELRQLEKIALDTAILPLCQRLMAFINFRKWNAVRFAYHTELDVSIYSRIKNGRLKKPSLRTILAIYIGLQLNYPLVENLLRSVGLAFSNSEEDYAYRYVVLEMHGCNIDEANIFLTARGVQLLGSISQDECESA
jgi:hypothetical protein